MPHVIADTVGEESMAYHEVRMQPGDPTDGPLQQVIAYVDNDGKAHFPGDEGYVEPSPESSEFLSDYAQQLTEDYERVQSGQDQQFSHQQRETTVQEMERITGGKQQDVDVSAQNNPNAPDPNASAVSTPAVEQGQQQGASEANDPNQGPPVDVPDPNAQQ